MSDTNRVGLKIIKEVTRGTTPASPALLEIRHSGLPGLGFNPKTVTSNEINSDAQVSDIILVGKDAGGGINNEMSFGSHDDFDEAAMRGTWVNNFTKLNVTADSSITDAGTTADTYVVDADGASFKVGHMVRASGFTNAANNQRFTVVSNTSTTVVGASLSLVAEIAPPAGARLRVVGFEAVANDIDAIAGGTNGLTSATLDFTTLGLAVGMWLKLANFTNITLNNDWVRVSVIAANALDFDIVPTGWAADATVGGELIQGFMGDYVRNGTNIDSYTLEVSYNDHSPVTYAYFRGQSFGGMSKNFPSQDIVTGAYSLLGTAAELTETRVSGATDTDKTTTSIMNSSSDVGRIAENGVVVAGPNYVLGATIVVDNGLRPQNAVGNISPVDFGAGEFKCTGQLQTYFGNKDLATKLLDNTATSFDIRVKKNNQVMLFDLPRVKFTAGNPETGQKDSDVTLPLDYQAYKHSTLGYTMQIQRFSEVS